MLTYFVIRAEPSRMGTKKAIPTTIIEAMVTGLPVVTTGHAGIPEMVRDGEGGFVVAERDIDAIAHALITIIDNPNLRVQLGRNAALQVKTLKNFVTFS